MKFSTPSLRAIVLGIAVAQIATVTASRPDMSNDERDLSEADAVNTDQYWLPQLNSVGVQCGGTSMKTGDGGAYRCFRDGEGICRDEQLGSFGPGQWTFGIVDSNVTLYTPSNEISWQFCSDVTHVCIGEDHGTDGGQFYSQERPYLFFYNEKTHQYVGELSCDDTDGDDGENLGKPSILKMVELSYTGQYVDYGEEGIAVTKFKKGQTEDPYDNNALFEILVKKEGTSVTGDVFYNVDKCYWEQTCTNCGDELYDLFDFEFDFDLATFCAENIPLDENVEAEFQAVLKRFLNEDAECADAEAGVIGCTDEIYFDIDILEFINSNETCGTANGTSTLPTTRMLWEEEDENEVDDSRPGLIRGTDINDDIQGDLDDERRLRKIRPRRSRGRARGRGQCRKCRRRDKNNRKLLGINDNSDANTDEEPVPRSLRTQQRGRCRNDLECPVDLAKLFREQNATLFENVTEADVFNFNYLPSTKRTECEFDGDCPAGSICNSGTCAATGNPRFTLTWTGGGEYYRCMAAHLHSPNVLIVFIAPLPLL